MASVKKASVKQSDVENMTDEEIEAFNEEEAQRKQDLLDQQAKNRKSKNKAVPERDKTIIRGIAGDDQIRCISLRRIGLDNDEMSDIDEPIDLPKTIAGKLQDAGAIMVKL